MTKKGLAEASPILEAAEDGQQNYGACRGHHDRRQVEPFGISEAEQAAEDETTDEGADNADEEDR